LLGCNLRGARLIASKEITDVELTSATLDESYALKARYDKNALRGTPLWVQPEVSVPLRKKWFTVFDSDVLNAFNTPHLNRHHLAHYAHGSETKWSKYKSDAFVTFALTMRTLHRYTSHHVDVSDKKGVASNVRPPLIYLESVFGRIVKHSTEFELDGRKVLAKSSRTGRSLTPSDVRVKKIFTIDPQTGARRKVTDVIKSEASMLHVVPVAVVTAPDTAPELLWQGSTQEYHLKVAYAKSVGKRPGKVSRKKGHLSALQARLAGLAGNR